MHSSRYVVTRHSAVQVWGGGFIPPVCESQGLRWGRRAARPLNPQDVKAAPRTSGSVRKAGGRRPVAAAGGTRRALPQPTPRSTPTRTLAAAHGGPPKTRHASAAQRLPPLPSPLTPPRRTSHQIHRKGTCGIPGKAGCVLGRIRPPPNQTSRRQGKHYTKSRRNDVSGVQASHRGALVAQCCGVPHATRPRPHGCS